MTKCSNPTSHGRLKIHVFPHHHVFPQAWGGAIKSPNTMGTEASPYNLVVLCATCHDNAHALLDQYVHHMGVPGRDVLREYDRFTRDLAARAWKAWLDGHPGQPAKPPYTLTHVT